MLKTIDLNDWILTGGGVTADSYFHKHDTSVMLKLYNPSVADDLIQREYDTAKSIYVSGLPSPAVYDIVLAHTELGAQKGITFERIIGKESFSRACQTSGNVEEWAAVFAREAKALHAKPCDTSLFPSQKAYARELVKEAYLMTDEEKQRYLAFLDTVPDAVTCLHGDLHSGNLITAGGKRYWIDLSDFSYGVPEFDLGVTRYVYIYLQDSEIMRDNLHMNEETMERFYNGFRREYVGSDDPAVLEAWDRKIAPYAVYFLLRTLRVRDPKDINWDYNREKLSQMLAPLYS